LDLREKGGEENCITVSFIICILHLLPVIRLIKLMKLRRLGHVVLLLEIRESCKMLAGKAEKQEIALQNRHSCKVSIKMDLREIYSGETNGLMLLSR
jgi:hypothetical protein